MAVAANPYVAPTRIQISVSEDAGQYLSASSDRRSTGSEEELRPPTRLRRRWPSALHGAASPSTRGDCQGASGIFIAALHGNQFSYHAHAKASGGALLDRPNPLAPPGGQQQILVAWAAPTWPDAERSLRPIRSTTQVALLTAQVDLRNLVTRPRVAQAPFGSARAISGEGVLGLAVAGRDGSDGLTVGVYQCVMGCIGGSAVRAALEPSPTSSPAREVPSSACLASPAYRMDSQWHGPTRQREPRALVSPATTPVSGGGSRRHLPRDRGCSQRSRRLRTHWC